jgi:hypothetical protein
VFDRRAIVVMFTALLMASCATVAPKPPYNLLLECPEPAGGPRTNGELATYTQQLREALRGCNRDKESLREWAEKQ